MIFNSRDTKYKTPFGAVSVKRSLTLKFPLSDNYFVSEGFVEVRKGDDKRRFKLEAVGAEGDFNIFETTFSLNCEGVYWYKFCFYTDKGDLLFGADEFRNAVLSETPIEWQQTVFREDYKTPDFIKGGAIYHIFADRFNKSGLNKTERNYRLHQNWSDTPEIVSPDGKYYADDFFGGNIRGIIEKLDYLRDLGISVIYLSPIFEAQSNHRYDTGDFFKIDPLFGSEQDFKKLIMEADARGIGIILDGVFNHMGADSIYFNKFGTYQNLGAYQSQRSDYYDWFTFQNFPDEYTCWWGCTNVPTVVHNNPAYKKMILGEGGVIDKWTSLGVKGWRLDVVDELPVNFVTELRKAVKRVNPEAVIIGEVWEDASTKVSYDIQRPYFDGYQLDGVMNYPFRNAILNFVLHGDINAFKCEVWTIQENYPKQSLLCCMNVISTHDTVRALSSLAEVDLSGESKETRQKFRLDDRQKKLAKNRLKLAALLQYTLTGVPSLFYGDEAGMEGFEDPLNRGAYPWGEQDTELLEFYKLLGKTRHKYRDLAVQDLKIWDNYDVLAYSFDDGNKQMIVAVNPSNEDKRLETGRTFKNVFSGLSAKDEYVLKPNEFVWLVEED